MVIITVASHAVSRESHALYLDDLALTDEIARRKVNVVGYCKPQDNGDIVILGARFIRSNTPTANLYLRTEFEFNDGLGETIRELGVFLGTQILPNRPAGQTYFSPGNLQSPSTLLAIDYITAIKRGVGARQTFDLVLTF